MSTTVVNFISSVTLGLVLFAHSLAVPINVTGVTSSTASRTTTGPTTTVHPLTTQTTEFQPRRICQQNLFTCANEECVPFLKVCDGTPDCSDSSDERDCDNLSTVVLGEQMMAIMTKYPGCPEASQHCSSHIAALGGIDAPSSLPNLNTSSACQAYSRAVRCIVWEACQYSQEDREFMHRLSAEIIRRESGCVLTNLDRSPRCVSQCGARQFGDFQSCRGCGVYVTCVGGLHFDYRPCPSGLVWDDDAKRCQWYSSTCPEL